MSTPPFKLKITRLAEAQLPRLVDLETTCTAMYRAQGIDDVLARGEHELAQLTKRHNVRVAEADEVVAGYVAWRDESPGVAYIEELSVAPEWQRKGIGRRLFEAVREEATALRLPYLLLRTRPRAPWAAAFWKKAGFVELADGAPEPLQVWKREQTTGGFPLSKASEVVLWIPLA